MPSRLRPNRLLAAASLLLAALACTCGSLPDIAGVATTLAVQEITAAPPVEGTALPIPVEPGGSQADLDATATSLVATVYAAAGLNLTATPDPGTGSITGRVCYPSEGIPPLTVYAQNVSTFELFSQEQDEGMDEYIFSGLPPAEYIVFAYTNFGDPAADLGGGYTVYLSCDNAQGQCADHSPVILQLSPGQTITGADICDWYAPPGDTSLPPNPKLP